MNGYGDSGDGGEKREKEEVEGDWVSEGVGGEGVG